MLCFSLAAGEKKKGRAQEMTNTCPRSRIHIHTPRFYAGKNKQQFENYL